MFLVWRATERERERGVRVSRWMCGEKEIPLCRYIWREMRLSTYLSIYVSMYVVHLQGKGGMQLDAFEV